jgi:hypothetical protein
MDKRGSKRRVRVPPETPEGDAGRVVSLVLKGEYSINDTGAEPGQYDVRIVTGDGRRVAMEKVRSTSGGSSRVLASTRRRRRRPPFAASRSRRR